MSSAPPSRFALWQASTVTLLSLGYAGYYLCRSDLSVSMPLLIQELSAHGVSPNAAKIGLGSVASFGVLAYALGKFPSGWLADRFGGRTNFLTGMAGAILFTVLFGLAGGMPLFTLAWMGNRAVQSMGWGGMVKITSRWFSFSTYGTVMGFISLSYLFGDAASREFMARLIDAGFGWRGVFAAAAGTLTVLLLLNLLLLRESPGRLGFPEPPANPLNLFHGAAASEKIGSRELFRTLARSRAFWLICLLSLGVTLLRETFNLWTPPYFTQAVGLSPADAAHKSALFPLFGGVSVLLSGFMSDRLGHQGRAIIMVSGLSLTAAILAVLAWGDLRGSQALPVVLVTLTAFVLIGPYSYLAGAISLDFGGKQGSATASGMIDGIGYLGGVLAGNTVAGISVVWGWQGAFAALTGVAVLSSAVAALYLWEERWRKSNPALTKSFA